MRERTEIGGYRLVKRLGVGGMATVYEAEDGGGNRVAFKLLHSVFADEAGRRRLAREVSVLQKVSSPYVARVLDVETEGDDAFLVTELIDGPTLEQDVTDNGVYRGHDLVVLAEELYEALNSIHSVGVLHRDIKPSNVMMSENGPVLIDFGISQIGDDSRLTAPGAIAQTPGYCDSRILDGAEPDEEADWWALAAVLAFAATGRPPFGRGSAPAILRRVMDGEVDVAGLPTYLARALSAALAPRPRISIDSLLDVLHHPEQVDEILPSWASDKLIADQATEVLVANTPEDTHTIQVSSRAQWAKPRDEELLPIFSDDNTETMAMSRDEQADFIREVLEEQYEAGVLAKKDPDEAPPWAKDPAKISWLVVLGGLSVVSFGALWPVWTVIAYMFLVVGLAFIGKSWEVLRAKRLAKGGPYGGEFLGVAGRSPWLLLRSLVFSVLAFVPAAIVAGALAWLFVQTGLVDSFSFGYMPGIAGVVSVAIFVVVTWIFPTVSTARMGARVVAKVLAPTWGYKIFWASVFLVTLIFGAYVVWAGYEPQWAPLDWVW